MSAAPADVSAPAMNRHLQAYCGAETDAMGFPRVPSVVETDFRVVYGAENMCIPFMPEVDGDFYLHMHMSGIVVFGIARGHPIFERGLTIQSVLSPVESDAIVAAEAAAAAAATDAESGASPPSTTAPTGRPQNANRKGGPARVSGKRKKGAIRLAPGSRVCVIHCTNGQRFTFRTPTKGRVLELNPRLLTPDFPEGAVPSDAAAAAAAPATLPLLTTDPEGAGYLGLLEVTAAPLATLTAALLPESSYTALVARRTPAQRAGTEPKEVCYQYGASSAEGARDAAAAAHAARRGKRMREAPQPGAAAAVLDAASSTAAEPALPMGDNEAVP